MDPIIWVIIGIAVIIILYVIFTSNKKQSALNEFKNNIKTNTSLRIESSIDKNYDFYIDKEDIKYYVLVVDIPSYADISVNNPVTYEAKYGGGSRPGAHQPNSKYLHYVKNFINAKYEGNIKKVICFYPKPKSITKWINENEMIEVNPKTDCYGINLMSFDEKDYWK